MNEFKMGNDNIIDLKHITKQYGENNNTDTMEVNAVGKIFEKNNKEIARLEGSFPIDYLNKVIDKLKLEV